MTEIERVIRIACGRLGLEYEELMGGKQTLKLWRGRYMIWHYMHCDMGISSGKIAACFGRERGSVFRGIRLIKHEMKICPKVREVYYGLCKEIEGAAK